MIRFETTESVIGAYVSGCELASVPSEEDIAIIEGALEKHGVLIFRDQQISPAQQIAFSRAFAELEMTSRVSARLDGHPEIFVVGNVDGQVVSFAPADGSDELEWHADHMHLQVPARASMLYCLETPPVGGETLFACMYSAYDALTAAAKAEADTLTALHSVSGLQSFLRTKGVEGAAEGAYNSPESLVVRWPLVRHHPLTGRKALYFGSKVTIGIEGWPEDQARHYLDSLEAKATAQVFRYAHAWRPGDAVLWDNRRVLHAGTPYDMSSYARRMHRTTWREEHPII
ncbi:MAG: TauD/TfdA dioxygenase family protein [Paracoccaceae bacterium]